MPRRSLLAVRRATAAMVLALPLTACQSPTGLGEVRRDLGAAKLRWARARPAAYDLTIERVCYCMPRRLAVTVRGTQVVSVRDAVSGAPVTPADYESVLTVEGVFAHLDDAVARRAADVTAEYDPALGYPVRTFVDYDESVADEELGYRVRDFTPR